MAASSIFKTLGTVLLKVAAFWVLLVAAYLALGRQFFPYIERYDAQVEAVLSKQLGTEVSIGELTGEWRQFNPVLVAERVRIGDTLAVRRVLLEPSLLQSLVNLSPVFKRFELTGFIARLEQQPDGWRMTGLHGANAADRMSLERLNTLLRQQREVVFDEVRLQIEPERLPGMTVVMDEGRMTGLGEDNWLRAKARLLYNDLEVPLELQLESTMQTTGYEVDLYARHGSLDFAPWLASRWPQVTELNLSGEYWVSLTRDAWQDMTVRLRSGRTRLTGPESDMTLSDVQTEWYAERTANGFDLWLNHLGHQLKAGTQEVRQGRPLQARINKRGSQWQAQWDQFPVAPISAWLALNDSSQFFRNAFPVGHLEQGKVTLNTDDWQSLRLTARLEEGSMKAYAGIPGITGVSAAVRAEGPVARLSYDVKQAGLSLPELYEQAFSFDRLSGYMDVRWWPGQGAQLEGRNNGIVAPLSSQPAGSPHVEVRNHWQVDIPPPKGGNDREIGFRLALDSEQATMDWATRLTPDYQVDGTAKTWMEDNLLSGNLSNLSFIYTGAFRSGDLIQSALGLSGEFEEARVSFDDTWPAVEGGRGRVALTGRRLDVFAEEGQLDGLTLDSGTLSLPFSDPKAQIQLQAHGNTGDALALFQSGPLAEIGKGIVEQWSTDGQAKARLELTVPFDGSLPEVTLQGEVVNANLKMPEFNLEATAVSGTLGYNQAQGLYAEQLTGELFGAPLRVGFRSENGAEMTAFEINVEGRTPVNAWGEWLEDPWLAAQPYRVPGSAQIRIQPERTTIDIRSTLENMPLDAPVPLGKAADELGDLALNLTFDDRQWLTIKANYNNLLTSYFELDDQQRLQRGSVSLGKPLVIHDDTGVFFDAHLEEAEVSAWQQRVSEIVGYYYTGGTEGLPVDKTDWLREITLSGDRWQFLGLEWDRPKVLIQRNDNAWLANVEAAQGQGRILIPHADEPIFADIGFLSLKTNAENADSEREEENTIDPLRQAHPLDVPEMNIQIAQLSINDRDFGHWRAEVVQGEDEVRARNLVGVMPGANLNGSLVWQYLDNSHRTSFDGTVNTGNINTLLRNWGYAPVLVSDNGRFELDLDWNGTPAFFDFSRLQGRIGLQLTNGAILELDEYEGVKLIGLLNFTRVLRRLALDFSDLIRDGITYDVIEGELLFDRGFARVGEKLIIDGPATKFRFSGDADLIRDTLDVDMVMTVPLSSTFPLVALLAGVSPQAAAAIYVTERVFNNELERLSSARMHVTGSLDAPEIRFYRVFDNSGGQQAPTVGDRLKNVVPGSTNP